MTDRGATDTQTTDASSPDRPTQPDTSDTGPSGLAAPGERGTLKVADKVVEKVASAAAHEIDDVIAKASGWRRVTGRPLPRATATIAGGRSRIGIDIATSWPTPLADVASRAREHVRERVTSLTGVDVVAVDVTVSHVIHPPAEGRKLS